MTATTKAAWGAGKRGPCSGCFATCSRQQQQVCSGSRRGAGCSDFEAGSSVVQEQSPQHLLHGAGTASPPPVKGLPQQPAAAT
jgi:hypothetical protein